jgi:hypothetical protein
VRKSLIACTALVLVGVSCYGPSPDETDEGKSRPVVAAEFPEVVEPSSLQTLSLAIENPGPGDFSSLFVAFSRVGAAEGVSLPKPIVDVPVGGKPSAVIEVRPDPVKVAEGIRFRFPDLPEGESLDIEFRLRMPARAGVAANSVQVYDGAEPDRIRGVLLSTRVQ